MLTGLEAEVTADIIAKKVINAYNSSMKEEVKIALDAVKCLVTDNESETEVINVLRSKYNMRMVCGMEDTETYRHIKENLQLISSNKS